MRAWIKNLSINGKLALAAALLGGLAVFGQPQTGGTLEIDTRELALLVETKANHILPLDLADEIIQGNGDIRLLDLRDEEAFAAYHIPGAEHCPISGLPDYPIKRNERIVLYSDGGIHSAQGWFLLKANKYQGAVVLLGGLDAWKDEVLFPALPEAQSLADVQASQRAYTVAAHFGGKPRTGAEALEAPVMVMPKVDRPTGVPVRSTKKKRREGC